MWSRTVRSRECQSSRPTRRAPSSQSSDARTRLAGIDNQLYFTDHQWMLFGDAREVVGERVRQLAGDLGARAQAA
jgi:hypothetical protein